MSNALTKLSPKLQRNGQVQRLATQLTSVRRRNRELREDAEMSLSPMASTAWAFAGAAGQGALQAYMPERARTMSALGSAGLIIAGATTGNPGLVAAGQGMGAPLVAERVRDSLLKNRSSNLDTPAVREAA